MFLFIGVFSSLDSFFACLSLYLLYELKILTTLSNNWLSIVFGSIVFIVSLASFFSLLGVKSRLFSIFSLSGCNCSGILFMIVHISFLQC